MSALDVLELDNFTDNSTDASTAREAREQRLRCRRLRRPAVAEG